jgi:4-hydroxy-tetrahydrodipicolinate synthase
VTKKSTTKKLKGMIVLTPSPFTRTERINEKYLRKLLSFLIDSGVHGVFLLGSTGEGVSLKKKERIRSIQIAKDEIGGRIPLLVGAMDFSTARIIDRVKQIEDQGIDIIIASMPFANYYSDKQPVDQQEHFAKIFNAGAPDTKFCVYNLPSQTQNSITVDTFQFLQTQKKCIAMKDSSDNMTYFQELLYKLKRRKDFSLFTGSPWGSAVGIFAGADGSVSTPANIDPVGAVKLYESAAKGDVKAALKCQERLSAIRNTYGKFGMLAGCKYVLSLMDLCPEKVSSPLKQLTALQKRILRQEMQQFKFIKFKK